MGNRAQEIREQLLAQGRQVKEKRPGLSLLDILEGFAQGTGSLVRLETIPAREARMAEPGRPLPEPLRRQLAGSGIETLYLHQARSLDILRNRRNVVVVTGTASGKTLCYNLPVLESLLEDPRRRALYLFPTKALAQDQLKVLRQLGVGALKQVKGEEEPLFRAATYDGDTPGNLRSKIRDEARIVLTNPDMLHAGILPNHARWADFFSRLDTIVLDEIHVYRGVFGSNVGNVFRRLLRILDHYRARPRIVVASATIANPKALAEELTGCPFELVDEDGSPRGKRHFAIWNPPQVMPGGMERRSSNMEARDLMVRLIEEGYQVITFVRARQLTEVLLRYCQEDLSQKGGGLAEKVRAYRGGYLPKERREIEAALFSGELMGVISTNALELGIDVGSLDASILVGYPGTIASAWQQAGRAGRREAESVSVLIGHNLPIDQYLMRHPDYFFAQSPEYAVVDSTNPHILLGHLKCAAYELPLEAKDNRLFGEYAPALRKLLEEYHQVRTIKKRSYFSSTDYPAGAISLRTTSIQSYTIVEGTAGGNRVIGTMDEASAFPQLHPQAVYLHDAETFLVDELNLEERVAYVHRADTDYYTQAVSDTQIMINEIEREKTWNKTPVSFGNVSVTDTVVMFKKIKFGTRESIGYGDVDLPAQVLHTSSCWFTPSIEAIHEVLKWGRAPSEGMLGLSNVLSEVVGLFVMCDRQDVGTTVDAKTTGAQAIFIYDKYPGGLGFASKAYKLLPEILEACRLLVSECECEGGCPSCVGSPIPPFAQQDPDTQGKGKIPDKEAALILIHALLGLKAYKPKGGTIHPVPVESLPIERLPIESQPGERLPGVEKENLERNLRKGDLPDSEAPQEPMKRLPREVERRLRELLEAASNSHPRQKGVEPDPLS
ncbi:MAG: DEAD/DEAH box helicase [Candidatus Eisenbacteria bacterium]|uniref:DEAD/DEAH box helicase n=1 Tax=Eiseniibacteriota bacterium TaxID=2212470 RepID=A0A948W7W4_UNCEI|nr:DEAD/DEAH box helicase [Candidatus Eisenbacteria bacterium]MBU1947262.1 DEAD/DEAH box helicase [Candidatus Eisenbacteria bacterium]MBU2693024.1 DEAD/DEAH box helicase [Candidatus Eisenbacteria bacterium]